MEHKIFSDNLSAYLDGELQPEEKARLEAHLAGCPDCRAALGQLRAVSGLVKAQALEPVPPALKNAVLSGRAPARPWLKPVLAFSAAAAGLLVVFNLTRPGEESLSPQNFAQRASMEEYLPAPEPAVETAMPAEAPAPPASPLYAAGAGKAKYAVQAVAAVRGSYAQAKFAAPRAAGAAANSAMAAAPEFRGRVAVQVSLTGQASAGMYSSLAFLRGTGTPLAAAAPGSLVFIKEDGSRVTLTEADCSYGFVLFDGRQDPLAVSDLDSLPAAYAKYFGAAPGR
ncbi:MAG: anti-sigma factor [Elusimicrobiales bacterium]